MKYVAFDPGETTGWAGFDAKGNGMGMGQLRGRTALYEFMAAMKPEVIIVEEYIVDPNVSHGGSKVETIRVLGAIEYHAWQTGARMVHQPRTIKGIGYRWAGLEVPKNHRISHQADAYVHGVYFLQRSGIRTPQQGAGT